MKQICRLSCRCLFLCLALVLSACSWQQELIKETTDFGEDLSQLSEPIVVVIDDPRSPSRRAGVNGPGYNVRFDYDRDPQLHRYAASIAGDYGVDIVAEWPVKHLGVHCFVIEKPLAQTLAALEADPRVRWWQAFNQFEVQSLPESSVPSERDASSAIDTQSLRQRFFQSIPERGRHVRIAVIDTGADVSHPDLTHSHLRFQDFVGDRRATDSESHGTAVLGMIAAQSQHSIVAGFAPEASLHLLRACWQEGSAKGQCNTLTLARALDAAVELGPQILNLSLTGPRDLVLEGLLERLLEQGTLVVAAYDEKRPVNRRFPTPQEGVIYAYGVDQVAENAIAPNTLYAQRHALSLAPASQYELASGHSIAAPQVSGMLACLMNRFPHQHRDQVVSHLKQWLNENFLAYPLHNP